MRCRRYRYRHRLYLRKRHCRCVAAVTLVRLLLLLLLLLLQHVLLHLHETSLLLGLLRFVLWLLRNLVGAATVAAR